MTLNSLQRLYYILSEIKTKEDETAKAIQTALDIIKREGNKKEKEIKPQFLFVEDGSIDVDNLQLSLEERDDVNVTIVVYRQGSERPQLVTINKEN